jgi:NADH-quinone oxidoreductase subunit E
MDHQEERTAEILSRYQSDAGSLVAVLQDLQAEFRYLPAAALKLVARELAIPLSRVLSLATFYRAFSLKPQGRSQVHVCLGTACHVRGGPLVLERFERELGVKAGETTADGEFSLSAVRCVGCCGLAPVVMVGEDVHGKISQTKVAALVKKYAQKQET